MQRLEFRVAAAISANFAERAHAKDVCDIAVSPAEQFTHRLHGAFPILRMAARCGLARRSSWQAACVRFTMSNSESATASSANVLEMFS